MVVLWRGGRIDFNLQLTLGAVELAGRYTVLHDALVLITGRVGSARSMAAFDLTRNDPDLAADVIYGLDPGPGARCAPGARIAGRATYL